MIPAMTTLYKLIYSAKRTTLSSKDVAEMLTSVFYSHGGNVKAYTYNGGTIVYVWGHAGSGHGAVVVDPHNAVTFCTPIDSPVLPEGWKNVGLNSLRQCGALPHATA